LNALALAKVILIARHLHFGARYDKTPLICTVLFKSAAFAALLGRFKFVEEAFIGSIHGHFLDAGISAINSAALTRIAVLTTILSVALIPFLLLWNWPACSARTQLRNFYSHRAQCNSTYPHRLILRYYARLSLAHNLFPHPS
jgi:hypothetical protein